MPKPTQSAHQARVVHRYLGFFLAGIMAVYAISGVVLIFRKGNTFKQEVTHHKTLATGLADASIGKELKLKNFSVERTEADVVYFENGRYNRATGEAEITKMELPYVLGQMTHLHKSTTNDPLYWLNIFFGFSLLGFVISAFWMYLPGGPILRRGLIFAAAGFVLTMVLLFV